MKQQVPVDVKALATRAIELRNKGDMGPVQIAQQVAKEFDITLSEFTQYYDQAKREYYDDLSIISNIPLAVYFKLFARNKHGVEKHVGYVMGISPENAIDVFFDHNKPFFFDKDDVRTEVLQDINEFKDAR